MKGLLVSVRSAAEAVCAAEAGVDFVDLKEPAEGALGALPLDTVDAIVAALRKRRADCTLSATVGDLPMGLRGPLLARVHALAARGVDLVKVGIVRHPGATALLATLADCGVPVVPVFIADRGLDEAVVARAAGMGFAALMLDTADKRAGSLFELMDEGALRRFVALARGGGTPAGLAGALRLKHLPALQRLAPDFAGFRSAVCEGDRAGALDPVRLRALVDATAWLRRQQQAEALQLSR